MKNSAQPSELEKHFCSFAEDFFFLNVGKKTLWKMNIKGFINSQGAVEGCERFGIIYTLVSTGILTVRVDRSVFMFRSGSS